MRKDTLQTSCFNNISGVVYLQDNSIRLYELKNNEDKLLIDLENEKLASAVFINNEKDKLVFLTSDSNDFWVNQYSLINQELSKVILDKTISDVNIINIDQLANAYIYYQEKAGNSWTIALVTEKSTTPLIKDINYQGESLTSSVEQIENQIIYPECNPNNKNCIFISYNIKDKTSKNIEIAVEDGSIEVADVDLMFFDENSSKIIYQLPNKNIAYITDFDGYLWHHIYLSPFEGNQIKINGILVDSENNKKLLASSDFKSQAYIYDINYIGLKAIDLSQDLQVVDNQINIPKSCLLLKKKDNNSFWLKDFVLNEKKLILENKEYLLLI